MSHLPPTPDDGTPADPNHPDAGGGDEAGWGDEADPSDELVSAVLDGEATPDEAAQVDSDPTLSARRDELAAIRDAVAAPVPVLDELTARRLRERALAELSEVRHTPASRPARRPGTLVGVGAAAVILLVALIALPGLLGDDDESTDSVASGAADALAEEAAELFSTDSADDEGDAAEAPSPWSDDAGPPEQEDGATGFHPDDLDEDGLEATDRPWLGSFESTDDLETALLRRPLETTRSHAVPSSAAECADTRPPWRTYGELWVWDAMVEGEPVIVVAAVESPSDGRAWWVVTVSDCLLIGSGVE